MYSSSESQLDRRFLKVVTLRKPPWMFPQSTFKQLDYLNYGSPNAVEEANATLIGAAYEIITAIAKLQKVAFHIDGPSGAVDYGAKLPGSQDWSGLLGQLMNGTVDIVAADMTASTERAQDFSFSGPLRVERLFAVLRRPATGDTGLVSQVDTFAVLKPFRTLTWLALVGAMILCAMFVAVLELSETFFQESIEEDRNAVSNKKGYNTWGVKVANAQPSPHDELDKRNSTYSLLSFVRVALRHVESMFRHITLRDTPYIPSPNQQRQAAKLLIAFWALFCSIFMTLYPAELFSSLTVPRKPPVLFDDFVSIRDAGYRLMGAASGPMKSVLGQIANETVGTPDGSALAQIVAPLADWPKAQTDANRRIIHSGERLIMFQAGIAVQKLQTATCDVLMLPLSYETSVANADGSGGLKVGLVYDYTAFVMRKNDTELKREFDKHYETLRQYGILEAILNRRMRIWLDMEKGLTNYGSNCEAQVKQNATKANKEAVKLTLLQLTSTFLLLLSGLVLGIISLVIEFCVDGTKTAARKHKRKRSRGR